LFRNISIAQKQGLSIKKKLFTEMGSAVGTKKRLGIKAAMT
jgi:hypothetical protein